MSINWHNQYPQSWSLPSQLSTPVGYSLPAEIHLSITRTDDEHKRLNQLATEILDDPLLIMEFTNRVYQLMEQDFNYQSDRNNH